MLQYKCTLVEAAMSNVTLDRDLFAVTPRPFSIGNAFLACGVIYRLLRFMFTTHANNLYIILNFEDTVHWSSLTMCVMWCVTSMIGDENLLRNRLIYKYKVHHSLTGLCLVTVRDLCLNTFCLNTFFFLSISAISHPHLGNVLK